jgi:hypothetical protein
VIGRGKRQLRIVDRKVTVPEVEQATRAPEIVQQMAIDMEKIRVFADASNDVLVPDFCQQGLAALFQKHILPLRPLALTTISRLARLRIEGAPTPITPRPVCV